MSKAPPPTFSRVLRSWVAAALALVLAGPVLAHHGWTWAEDVNAEIVGTIVSARLGNPHGELTLAVGAERWTVEVGQPWRNERAGLTDALLAQGVQLSVMGHKHRDPKRKVFKAERLIIDGKTYDLYPDRN